MATPLSATRAVVDVARIPLAKRLLDVSLSGVGLLGSSPLWLMLALLVKVEDGGPVFYSQDRVG